MVCLITMASALYAQKMADTLVVNEVFEEKDLRDVIRYMQKKYDLKVAYESQLVREIKVNTVIRNANVDEAWKKILEGTELTHQFLDDRKMILRRKKAKEVNDETRNKEHNITHSTPYTFAGIIRDRETGETVPYATVVVAGTSRGTAANQNGFFSLTGLSSPQDLLVIKHLGYAPATIKIDTFQNTEIALQPVASLLEEVSVTDGVTGLIALTGKAGQTVVNPKEAGNLPQIGETDVFRSMQLLPGISIADETSASLSIRGSTHDQNLVLFDGFTIYHLDHLYGFFSSLNTDAIKDIRVYKGGFDARYGGRASSVIDITGKTGNQLKPAVSLGLNLLSANVAAETPIGDKATAFVSFRRSYTDVLQTQLFNTLFDYASNELPRLNAGVRESPAQTRDDSFYYFDVNGKFSYRFSDHDKISLSFYQGKDESKESTQLKLTAPNAMYQEDFREEYQMGNTGLGLQWNRIWGNRLFSTLSLGYSQYFKDYRSDLSASVEDVDGVTSEASVFLSRENELDEFSGRLDFEYNMNEKHFLEFGVYTIDNSIRYTDETNIRVATRELKAEGAQTGAYVQDTYKPLENLQVTLGIRNTYYSLTNQLYFEPRLSVKYELTDGLHLKGATGRYYQFISQAETSLPTNFNQDFWVLMGSEGIPVLSANHYVGGISYMKEGWMLDAEVYRKDMQGLIRADYENSIEENNLRPLWNYNHLITNGEGKVTGLDMMIRKTWEKYTPTLSYSLATVKHQYDEINGGERFYADNDQRHELKFINEWNLHPWTFSLNWIYGSGRPYSIPTEIISENGISRFVYGEKNNERLPVYHRMDVSGAYEFKLGKGLGNVGFSLFNLYDRNNVGNRSFLFDRFDIFQQGRILQVKQVIAIDQILLGRTFSLFINFKF